MPITPAQRDAGVIGVLVDQSRSMGLSDADGLSRLERAAVVIQQSLLPSLGDRWRVETWLFGDGVRDARDVAMAPTADRSDLAGAVTSAVERLRGRSLAGLVVLTDGARTDRANLADIGSQAGVPIVTIGIGRTDGRDIAVRSVTASESRLDASLVDLTVAAESRQLARSGGDAAAPGRTGRRAAERRSRAGRRDSRALHGRAGTPGAHALHGGRRAEGR